jgi:RimJ/RimL family protein N-acetyltransferase
VSGCLSEERGPAELRPFRAGDARALLAWATTADELLQWAGPRFSFPLDERQLVAHADTDGEERHAISAVLGDHELPVGHAELEILPEHELGRIGAVAVAPHARGRGIGAKLVDSLVDWAFEELSLHRLELVVFSFNEPARRIYRRAGFREEGLAVQARRASDGRWDLVYMGMLVSWRVPRAPRR